MKPWTTPQQHAWLKERIPNWLKGRSKKDGTFLKDVVTEFLKEFPTPEADRPLLREVSPRFSSLLPLEQLLT